MNNDEEAEKKDFQEFLDYLEAPSSPNELSLSKDAVKESRQKRNVVKFIEESSGPNDDNGDHQLTSRSEKKKPTEALVVHWTVRRFFFFAAFVLALFPSVMKMYETSHWFREGDPSVYDDAKDWFANPALPFQAYFDNSKVLMRVYFFIIPYILSAFCVAVGLGIPAVPSPNPSIQHLQQRRRVFGLFLRRTLAFPSALVRFGLPVRISVAEVIGIVTFLTLNLMTIGVRITRSLPRGSRKIHFLVDIDEDASKDPIDPFSWQACEVWAKTLGVISILNLGWYLLMPVGRKSMLLEALNISWERAIKYHRWVGYYSVFIMIVHGIMYLSIWIHGNDHPSYDPDGVMLESNVNPSYCINNECDEDQARMLRVNMYGWVTLFLILVMTAFTLPWIRRQKFEWFYYAHHLFILVLIFVTLHYKGSVIYLLPGIAIYGVDKLMALYSYHKAAPVATRILSNDVLEISFEIKAGIKYKAGDYLFLNVPSVSFLQWHPFSITSAPSAHGTKVMFHLKGVSGGWTEKVINEALKQGGNTLNVRLDGFYGVNSICDQLQSKDGVILVGGGIGVTPMMSLAIEMCNTSSIPLTLLWVVRDIDEFGIFSTELVDAESSFKHFKAKAWVTLSTFRSSPKLDGGKFDRSELLQFNNFNESLRCINKSWYGHTTAPEFVLDQPSLSGAWNAMVMAMSTTFALVAYALAAKTASKDSYSDTPQDLISLLELAMVCFAVLLWVVIVIVTRRVLAPVGPSRTEKMSPVTQVTSRTERSDDSNDVSDTDSGFLSEKTEGDTQTLESILEGGIGCRLDVSDQFSSFAEAVTQNMDRPADIAVLACGPPKLVESINDYINVASSTFGGIGVDRNQQAFFSFTEEDWEW